MSKINDGGLAFPTMKATYDSYGKPILVSDARGMSLRDYFAGQVIAGLYAGRRESDNPDYETSKCFVEEAFGVADAMIAARNKE